MAGRRQAPPVGVRPRLTPTQDLSVDDPTVDRILDSHARGLSEIQLLPAFGLRVVQNVELVEAKNTFVAHPLGRLPVFVGVSAIRGALTAGMVRDITDGKLPSIFASPVDRNRFVVLRADGYGATIHVDIMVI